MAAMVSVAGAHLSLVYTPQWVENMTAGRGWIALALTNDFWLIRAGWYALQLVVSLAAGMVPFDPGRVVALRLEDGAVAWEQVVAIGEGRGVLRPCRDDPALARR